jgi:hypothetical protein
MMSHEAREMECIAAVGDSKQTLGSQLLGWAYGQSSKIKTDVISKDDESCKASRIIVILVTFLSSAFTTKREASSTIFFHDSSSNRRHG